jgi:ParB family chromosome partitioning protein
MSAQKKRGLGRGLGALIPTTPEQGAPANPASDHVSVGTAIADRPADGQSNPLSGVDLFFPTSDKASNPTKGRSRSDAWDSAMGGGRLSIKADGGAKRAGTGDVIREAFIDNGKDLLPVPGATYAEVPLDSIRPNHWQPRTVFDETDLQELVDSIKEIGVLQPVVVRPDPENPGKYELIMGERRWRASGLAGEETIPAIIRATEDSDMLRDALLENLHRSNLNPLEEAAAYRQLLDDFGITHEELATRIARSRPQISNTLRLLKLPPLVQRRVAAGVLTAGHARALLGLADAADIERLAQRIVAEGLSVRAVEEIVSLAAMEKPKRRTARQTAAANEAADALATRLSDRFDTRVRVQMGKTKGKVTVEFATTDDLNRILAVMAPEMEGVGSL